MTSHNLSKGGMISSEEALEAFKLNGDIPYIDRTTGTKTTWIGSKSDQHKEICKNLYETYVKKNHDYGDSFGESYKDFGDISALVRITDKMNRLKTLIRTDNKVKDESIDDTIKDMANYLIMWAIERDKPKVTQHDREVFWEGE